MERRADFRVVEGSSPPPLSTSPIGRAQFLNDINHRALLLVWQIVDAVHKNGSFFPQLMALGHTAHPDVLREEGGYQLVAPSSIPMSTLKINDNTSPSSPPPRALTVEEIREYVQLY